MKSFLVAVGGLLTFGGGALIAVIDVIAIYRCFTEHSVGWAVLSLTPPGWFIAPFKTGLGTYFVIGLIAAGIGAGLAGDRDA